MQNKSDDHENNQNKKKQIKGSLIPCDYSLLADNACFQDIMKNMMDQVSTGFALVELILDKKGSPVDYRFLQTNEKIEQIYGEKTIKGQTIRSITPNFDPSSLNAWITKSSDKKPIHQEHFSQNLDLYFERKIIPLNNTQFVILYKDITYKKQKENHLNRIKEFLNLLINNYKLNQIEYSEEKILKKLCRAIVERLEYDDAWIILLDQKQRIKKAEQANIGEDFQTFLSNFQKGKISKNAKKTLQTNEIIVENKPQVDCDDCLLSEIHSEKGVMHIKLEKNSDILGILTASISIDRALNKEEQLLFKELSQSISTLLYIKEKDDARKQNLSMENNTKDFDLKPIIDPLFEYTNDGIWIIDEEYNTLFVNQSLLNMIGYTFEEIQGHKIHDFIDASQLKNGNGNGFLKLDYKQPFKDLTIINKKGEKIHTIFSTAPQFNKQKNFKGATLFIKDVSDLRILEQHWRESENKYKTLFENANDAIVIMKNGIAIDCNKQTTLMYRCSKDDIIGKTPADFSPEVQPDGISSFQKGKALIEKTLEGESQHFEWLAKRMDGQLFYASISLNSFFKNKEIFIFSIIRDIDENKRIENIVKNNEELFRQMFEEHAVVKLLIDYDDDCRIVRANKAAYQYYGYTENELYLLPLSEINLLSTKELKKELKQALRGEKHKFYSQHQLANGEIRDVEVITNPIDYKGRKHLYSMIYDVSDRVKMENELKEALEKAQLADQLKSAFLANMSHEIRTPLTAILGFADIALIEKEIPESAKDKFVMIKQSGELLLSIINDILDLSKIEANQLKIQLAPHELSDIITNIHSRTEALIHKNNKEIEIKLNIAPEVNNFLYLDYFRFNQVINNLISNAIKFTEQGQIEIGCSLTQDQTYLQFYIKDTGIGIPKEKQESIFNAFEQADLAITKKYGGTGLGLTITRKLIELMGGTIRLESKLKQGSTFYFTIPYKPTIPPEEKDMNQVNSWKNPSKQKTILLAEDDLLNQSFLQSILKKYNYNVLLANNGQEAIRVFRENPSIDIILMDIKMPKVDGYKALAEIRKIEKQDQRKSIPIFALTAYAMNEDVRKGLGSGFDEYITKPFDTKKLVQILEFYLK